MEFSARRPLLPPPDRRVRAARPSAAPKNKARGAVELRDRARPLDLVSGGLAHRRSRRRRARRRPPGLASLFGTVLVANRGEIARRVFRACRQLGLKTVAVYSEADRDAPHVRDADEAVLIGPGPARESYLAIDKILEAVRQTGAEAVHPGYGFLSENWRFAQACADAGVTFIGPAPDAIRRMGDKSEARRLMAAAGVPVVPGTPGAVSGADEIVRAADPLGY